MYLDTKKVSQTSTEPGKSTKPPLNEDITTTLL